MSRASTDPAKICEQLSAHEVRSALDCTLRGRDRFSARRGFEELVMIWFNGGSGVENLCNGVSLACVIWWGNRTWAQCQTCLAAQGRTSPTGQEDRTAQKHDAVMCMAPPAGPHSRRGVGVGILRAGARRGRQAPGRNTSSAALWCSADALTFGSVTRHPAAQGSVAPRQAPKPHNS